MRQFSLAIVGATGLVGQAFIDILFERNFPLSQLYLLASPKSAGKIIHLPNGEKNTVINSDNFDWQQHQPDIALFSAGADIAQALAPKATAANCLVIDNSSAFRQEPTVPLVIPEVNGDLLTNYQGKLIANPNCSTIQMLVALYPIYQAVGIKRIIVSTYQAASGAGGELVYQLTQSDKTKNASLLANNVIPQIDQLMSEHNNYSCEELKMLWETQKILNDPEIKLSATAVRVPVVNGHSEAITIETQQAISLQKAIDLLKQPGQGIVYQEPWVTPKAISGTDSVYVSRVRDSLVFDRGLSLWVVADNIRKGAALNAIQIAEYYVNFLQLK